MITDEQRKTTRKLLKKMRQNIRQLKMSTMTAEIDPHKIMVMEDQLAEIQRDFENAVEIDEEERGQ